MAPPWYEQIGALHRVALLKYPLSPTGPAETNPHPTPLTLEPCSFVLARGFFSLDPCSFVLARGFFSLEPCLFPLERVFFSLEPCFFPLEGGSSLSSGYSNPQDSTSVFMPSSVRHPSVPSTDIHP